MPAATHRPSHPLRNGLALAADHDARAEHYRTEAKWAWRMGWEADEVANLERLAAQHAGFAERCRKAVQRYGRAG